MKTNTPRCIFLSVLALAGTSHIHAQVEVDFIVEFPQFAVLEYLSEVTVDLEAVDIGGALFAGATGDANDASAIDDGADTLAVTFDSGVLTGDDSDATVMGAGATASNFASLTLNLPTVWAIRSNASGDVTAAAAAGTTLDGDNGGTIDLSAISVIAGDFAATGFAAANREFGGVTLTMDLTDATDAGTYSTTDPTYTLSVTFD